MTRIKAFLRYFCFHKLGNEWLWLAIGLLAGLFAIAGCLGRLSWIFDLLANFQPQYALALLVSISCLLIFRKWRLALLVSPFLLLSLILLAPLYMPSAEDSAAPAGRSYKLLSFNVHSINRDISSIESFIESENPDFIVITELTPKWSLAVERLSKRYKLQIQEPSDDNFGIAVFGRFDAEIHLSRTDDQFCLPTHCADFSLPDGRRLRLAGVHSPPPKCKLLADERMKCLLQAARLCRNAGIPSILAGDFNMTPFSPFFNDLLKEGALRSAAQGRGLGFTWPSSSYMPIMPLSMQIDHCLVSKGVNVHSWRIGPDLKSDHLPLLVEFSLK